jgi:hypothetical protein
MMKSLLLLCAALLLATSALAVIDEEENVIGLYFDTDADTDCLDSVSSNTQIPCYIILTNPTFSNLRGFELGYDYGSELMHLGTELANSQAMNVGSTGNLVVGFGAPTQTEEATLLATLNMLYIDMNNSPTSVTLRGSSPSSLDPAFPSVVTEDEMISTRLHESQFTHQMNGVCQYTDLPAAWDEVKSLYR